MPIKAPQEFLWFWFQATCLETQSEVEEISKEDLRKGLRAATKDSQKGDYYENKTSHGQKLLELIDSNLVRNAAPNCERLFAAVLEKLA